jgi:hypothetical protein
VGKIYCTAGLVCVLLYTSWTGMAGAAEYTDPMRPMNYRATMVDTNTDTTNEKKKTDSWKLTAVLLSDKRSVAVVNGQSMQLGDVHEGYTLMGIYEDRVVLNGKGRKLILERSGTGLKKKSVQRK